MSDYLLVDLENVPNPDLSAVPEMTHVWLFVGANQKVSSQLAVALVARRGEFRKLTAAGQGRNALDLHIAYYLGHILASDPQARCQIISRDGDYDVLRTHLVQLGHRVSRYAPPDPAPAAASESVRKQSAADPLHDESIKLLRTMAAKLRPRTRKSLSNKLLSDLRPRLSKTADSLERIDRLINDLSKKGCLTVKDGKVSYDFARLDS